MSWASVEIVYAWLVLGGNGKARAVERCPQAKEVLFHASSSLFSLMSYFPSLSLSVWEKSRDDGNKAEIEFGLCYSCVVKLKAFATHMR